MAGDLTCRVFLHFFACHSKGRERGKEKKESETSCGSIVNDRNLSMGDNKRISTNVFFRENQPHYNKLNLVFRLINTVSCNARNLIQLYTEI